MTIELNDTKDDCETFGFMGIGFRNVMSWLLAIILFIGMVIHDKLTRRVQSQS